MRRMCLICRSKALGIKPIACLQPDAKLAAFDVSSPGLAEVLTGSTRLKAGTAQKMVLNMLTTASMIRIGKTYRNYMIDVSPTNIKLRDRATRIVSEIAGIDYDKAASFLEKTDYRVKPAVVMALLNVDLKKRMNCATRTVTKGNRVKICGLAGFKKLLLLTMRAK